MEHHFARRERARISRGSQQYSLDVAGISSTKRRGSNTVELDDWWKLFYYGVESEQFAQAGMGILIKACWYLLSTQLANCVDEWIPLGGRVGMLRLKFVWYKHTDQNQVHCSLSSWKKLVMPCERLKLTNPSCFRETSMHNLGTKLEHGTRDWPVSWCWRNK